MCACTWFELLSFEANGGEPFLLHCWQKTQFERTHDPHFDSELGSQEGQAIFYIFWKLD